MITNPLTEFFNNQERLANLPPRTNSGLMEEEHRTASKSPSEPMLSSMAGACQSNIENNGKHGQNTERGSGGLA